MFFILFILVFTAVLIQNIWDADWSLYLSWHRQQRGYFRFDNELLSFEFLEFVNDMSFAKFPRYLLIVISLILHTVYQFRSVTSTPNIISTPDVSLDRPTPSGAKRYNTLRIKWNCSLIAFIFSNLSRFTWLTGAARKPRCRLLSSDWIPGNGFFTKYRRLCNSYPRSKLTRHYGIAGASTTS